MPTFDVAKSWQAELRGGGYEPDLSEGRLARIHKYRRTWRTILRKIRVKPGMKVLEFGVGGGGQLMPLAVNGWDCCGVDCSIDVLRRCRRLCAGVEAFRRKKLNVKLICADFLSFELSCTYDMVFNNGVIEHFLDDRERKKALEKMFSLCNEGGYVVSIVPNGAHPLRRRVREEGLGGYRIPEVDYGCESLARETEEAGGSEVVVIPHNLFGYLNGLPERKVVNKIIFYLLQLCPRVRTRFTCRHAYSLICIARRG